MLGRAATNDDARRHTCVVNCVCVGEDRVGKQCAWRLSQRLMRKAADGAEATLCVAYTVAPVV
jgi:hypothetical protein